MKKSLFLCLAILFFGCSYQVKDTDSNEQRLETFKPQKIFDYDGVSVYRFFDGSNVIYYTNANGKTEWQTTRQNGKTRITETHHVNCLKQTNN